MLKGKFHLFPLSPLLCTPTSAKSFLFKKYVNQLVVRFRDLAIFWARGKVRPPQSKGFGAGEKILNPLPFPRTDITLLCSLEDRGFLPNGISPLREIDQVALMLISLNLFSVIHINNHQSTCHHGISAGVECLLA